MFSGQELSEILSDLHRANPIWLTLGLALTFLFISGEASIIFYMLKVLGQKTPFLRCLKYSFIGFFFSDITPSSSGGQPAQMFYMKKDGIKIGFSTLIMLIITIAYKSALVIMGIGFMIFRFDYIKLNIGGAGWLLVLGFILNAAFITALAVVFFKPALAMKIGIKAVNLLVGMKIIKGKNHEKCVEKIIRICDNYTLGISYIKENVHTVVNVFIITFLQRLSLFAVTWTVYRAFGLSGEGLMSIAALQIMLSIAAEMLPLPGAAGITEGLFMV